MPYIGTFDYYTCDRCGKEAHIKSKRDINNGGWFYPWWTEEKVCLCPKSESASKAFRYIPRIAHNRKFGEEKPHLKELYYIRGIVRNRMYCDDRACIEMLENAYNAGVPIEWLKEMAKTAKNWSGFRREVLEATGDE